ncbi:hypothetical protein SAMN04487983_102375 [Streptomyces sp. yr375]|nr:hypothetical protein SAMN04487983_102375 [Streptomyces sp. yr375]
MAAPAPTPVAVRLGGERLGDERALGTAAVLSPVMARWDEGAFLAPVAAALTAGHRVTVYDTLSLLRDGDDLQALAERWAGVLAAAPVDLLVGNALGGAVVQHLLAHPWTHRAHVVLLSAPTVADDALDATLERVAAAVEAHGTATALRLLHEVVRGPADPVTSYDDAPHRADDPAAGRRLADGLRLLRRADARRTVERFPGRLLHVHGAESRLVQGHHLATGPAHTRVAVPRAGMRPHTDQPDHVRQAITAFLAPDQPEDKYEEGV